MACVLNNYHSGFRQALICRDANNAHNTKQLIVQGGKVFFLSDNASYELDEKGKCFFSSLSDGDIVSVSERGVVDQVFSAYDSDATIFMTGNCNSNCIMCPSTDHERRRNYGDRRIVLEEFIEMLPNEVLDRLYKDDSSIIMVTFNESTSADSTVHAVDELRSVVGDASKISSMTSLVLDTRDISNNEMITYVLISVLLCLIVLVFATDSYIVPLFLLGNIGVAILYNMGTNVFLGDICYITKAITAVLQLGVTTDYSIFLYHKYEQIKSKEKDKRKAMSLAIDDTFRSVVGSSFTTFAGFLALCTMDLTLGTDIGLVMAKGVLFGLLTVFTIFPALLLTFDKVIDKTHHKRLFPEFRRIQKFTVKHHLVMFVIFIILVIPAVIGNRNYKVYYKLDDALPADLPFHVANSALADKFGIVSPEIILLDKNIKVDEVNDMVSEIKSLDGISLVLSPNVLMDDTIKNLMPEDLFNLVENDKYQIVLVNSDYEIASDELNKQVVDVDKIIKKYDKKAILAGEGPLMKDLVVTADHDFKMVNYTSIGGIFIITRMRDTYIF